MVAPVVRGHNNRRDIKERVEGEESLMDLFQSLSFSCFKRRGAMVISDFIRKFLQISRGELTVSVMLTAAWYERRQQKKIYSPLMEGLLAFYLGFEWMHVSTSSP